jgi:phospholipase/carboxylesterase
MNSSKPLYKVHYSGNDIEMVPEEYDSVLIWMHGLGGSAQQFFRVFDNPQCPPVPEKVKIVLPTANQARVSLMGGLMMNSWFDMEGSYLNFEDFVNEPDAQKSANRIEQIIERECQKLCETLKTTDVNKAYNRIFLGGISQGSAIALYTAMNYKNNIGGVICLSSFLIPSTSLSIEKQDLPIFACHGAKDFIIPETVALQSYQPLMEGSYNFQYHSFPHLGHYYCDEELILCKAFIESIVA